MRRAAGLLAVLAVLGVGAAAGAGRGRRAPPFLIINQEQILTGSEAGRALLADEERERDTLRAEARGARRRLRGRRSGG